MVCGLNGVAWEPFHPVQFPHTASFRVARIFQSPFCHNAYATSTSLPLHSRGPFVPSVRCL